MSSETVAPQPVTQSSRQLPQAVTFVNEAAGSQPSGTQGKVCTGPPRPAGRGPGAVLLPWGFLNRKVLGLVAAQATPSWLLLLAPNQLL